jgi:hypothetical protein
MLVSPSNQHIAAIHVAFTAIRRACGIGCWASGVFSLPELFDGIAITPTVEIAISTAVKTAYLHAFKVVFLVSIIFGFFIVAALMSLNMEGQLVRKLMKGQPVTEDEEL